MRKGYKITLWIVGIILLLGLWLFSLGYSYNYGYANGADYHMALAVGYEIVAYENSAMLDSFIYDYELDADWKSQIKEKVMDEWEITKQNLDYWQSRYGVDYN